MVSDIMIRIFLVFIHLHFGIYLNEHTQSLKLGTVVSMAILTDNFEDFSFPLADNGEHESYIFGMACKSVVHSEFSYNSIDLCSLLR